MLVVTCALGILCGVVGSLPLLVVGRLSMRPGSIVQQQAIMFGLLGIAGSSVACLVMLVVYRAVDPNGLVGFGAALIVAFLVSSCVIAVRGLSAQRR